MLVREMENFQVKVTDSGNEQFGAWREGEHDDLLLATALACWAAAQFTPPPIVAPVSFTKKSVWNIGS